VGRLARDTQASGKTGHGHCKLVSINGLREMVRYGLRTEQRLLPSTWRQPTHHSLSGIELSELTPTVFDAVFAKPVDFESLTDSIERLAGCVHPPGGRGRAA
jgi:hypothetical protein